MIAPISTIVYIFLFITFFVIFYQGTKSVFSNWSKASNLLIALSMATTAISLTTAPMRALMGITPSFPIISLSGVFNLILGGTALLAILMFMGLFVYAAILYFKRKLGELVHRAPHVNTTGDQLNREIVIHDLTNPILQRSQRAPTGIIFELDLTKND